MIKNKLFTAAIASALIISCLTAGCNRGCPACREAGLNHSHQHISATPDSRTITQYDSQDLVTIWITNTNGAMTPITLKKQNNQYIGPNNETYNEIPTAKQLKQKYEY